MSVSCAPPLWSSDVKPGHSQQTCGRSCLVGWSPFHWLPTLPWQPTWPFSMANGMQKKKYISKDLTATDIFVLGNTRLCTFFCLTDDRWKKWEGKTDNTCTLLTQIDVPRGQHYPFLLCWIHTVIICYLSWWNGLYWSGLSLGGCCHKQACKHGLLKIAVTKSVSGRCLLRKGIRYIISSFW